MENPYTADCVIIGGGPAGLSAAIYLARYNRQVLVIDRGHGRWSSHEINENYLGFPEGIAAKELVQRGRLQAEKFGAQIISDEIVAIPGKVSPFILQGKAKQYQTPAIILATGVSDIWPSMANLQEYLGKTVFWCITCDGHKAIGKRVVIVGQDEDTACTALQLLNFTPSVTLVTDCEKEKVQISDVSQQELAKHHIPLITEKIVNVRGTNGKVQEILLSADQTLPLDLMFSHKGAVPNTELARQLGITLTKDNYIEVDEEQRTNQAFIYAAGDVTRQFAHQIVTAAHEGATAGIAVNYDLYEPCQRSRE